MNNPLASLLTLQQDGNQFIAQQNTANPNGRIYGGLLMAQTIMTAHHSIAVQKNTRRLNSAQFTFLKGASPTMETVYRPNIIQQGNRFTTVNVTAEQKPPTQLFNATIGFSQVLASPSHRKTLSLPPETPKEQPLPTDMP